MPLGHHSITCPLCVLSFFPLQIPIIYFDPSERKRDKSSSVPDNLGHKAAPYSSSSKLPHTATIDSNGHASSSTRRSPFSEDQDSKPRFTLYSVDEPMTPPIDTCSSEPSGLEPRSTEMSTCSATSFPGLKGTIVWPDRDGCRLLVIGGSSTSP